MNQVANVFKAFSDPVRIEMIHRLSTGEHFNLSSISADLGVTRQGARKHLVVLEKAKIISLHEEGRNTEVRLNKDSLQIIKKFIATLEHQWDQRLLRLRKFVEETNDSK